MEDITVIKFGIAFIIILLALLCIVIMHMADTVDKLTLAASSYFYAILVDDGTIDENGNILPKDDNQ